MFVEKKEKEQKTLPGYFSIEATLVLGLVFYTFCFLIFIGFYQYNRCVLEQNAYRIALRASAFYRDDNAEVLQVAERTGNKLCDNRYIMLTCNHKEEVGSTVKVTLSGRMNTPSVLDSRIPQMEERCFLQIERKSACINPVVFIRACKQLEKELEKEEEDEEGIH